MQASEPSKCFYKVIRVFYSKEQHILDINVGKQLSQAAIDFELTLVLKKMTNI